MQKAILTIQQLCELVEKSSLLHLLVEWVEENDLLGRDS